MDCQPRAAPTVRPRRRRAGLPGQPDGAVGQRGRADQQDRARASGSALNGDTDARQLIVNELIKTTPPGSFLYYGYDLVADLANREDEAQDLKEQVYRGRVGSPRPQQGYCTPRVGPASATPSASAYGRASAPIWSRGTTIIGTSSTRSIFAAVEPRNSRFGRTEPARSDHDQVAVAPVELADRILDRRAVDDGRCHRNGFGQSLFRGFQGVLGMFERALANGVRVAAKVTERRIEGDKRRQPQRCARRLAEPNRGAQQQIRALALADRARHLANPVDIGVAGAARRHRHRNRRRVQQLVDHRSQRERSRQPTARSADDDRRRPRAVRSPESVRRRTSRRSSRDCARRRRSGPPPRSSHFCACSARWSSKSPIDKAGDAATVGRAGRCRAPIPRQVSGPTGHRAPPRLRHRVLPGIRRPASWWTSCTTDGGSVGVFDDAVVEHHPRVRAVQASPPRCGTPRDPALCARSTW